MIGAIGYGGAAAYWPQSGAAPVRGTEALSAGEAPAQASGGTQRGAAPAGVFTPEYELPTIPAGYSPEELAARLRVQYPEAEETKSAAEVMEDARCETCEKRKYQDGSDDPGVSFKTPTHVGPEMSAAAVRGHEQEHVTREQAKAEREGREVVSQSVTYRTGICPECGRVYVSGGTTRTVTANENSGVLDRDGDAEDPLRPRFAAAA